MYFSQTERFVDKVCNIVFFSGSSKREVVLHRLTDLGLINNKNWLLIKKRSVYSAEDALFSITVREL